MKPKAEIKRVKNRRAHFPIAELRNNTPNFFGHGKTRKLAAHSRNPHHDEDDEDEKSDTWIWLAAIGGLGAAGYLWIKNYPDKAREVLTSIGAMRIPGLSDLVDTIAGGKTPNPKQEETVKSAAQEMLPSLPVVSDKLSPGLKLEYTAHLADDADAKDGEFKFWEAPPAPTGDPAKDTAAAQEWVGRRYWAALTYEGGKESGLSRDQIIRNYDATVGKAGESYSRKAIEETTRRVVNTSIAFNEYRASGLPPLLFNVDPKLAGTREGYEPGPQAIQSAQDSIGKVDKAGKPSTDIDLLLISSALTASAESLKARSQPSNMARVAQQEMERATGLGINPTTVLTAFMSDPSSAPAQEFVKKLRAGFIADVSKTVAQHNDTAGAMSPFREQFKNVPQDTESVLKAGVDTGDLLRSAFNAHSTIIAQIRLRDSLAIEQKSDYIKAQLTALQNGYTPAKTVAASLVDAVDVPAEIISPFLGYINIALSKVLPTDSSMNRYEDSQAAIIQDGPDAVVRRDLNKLTETYQRAVALYAAGDHAGAKNLARASLSAEVKNGSEVAQSALNSNAVGGAAQNTTWMLSSIASRNAGYLITPVLLSGATIVGLHGQWSSDPEASKKPFLSYAGEHADTIAESIGKSASQFATQKYYWNKLDPALRETLSKSAPGVSQATLYQRFKGAVKATGEAVKNPKNILTYGKTVLQGMGNRASVLGRVVTSDALAGAAAPSTAAAANQFGNALRAIRLGATNIVGAGIIMEGVASAWDVGRVLYARDKYDDEHIQDMARLAFAYEGKQVGLFDFVTQPVNAAKVWMAREAYKGENQSPHALGYRKGLEWVMEAKLIKSSTDFANKAVLENPLFSTLPGDLQLQLARRVGSNVYDDARSSVEHLFDETNYIRPEFLEPGGRVSKILDNSVVEASGSNMKRGPTPEGLDKSVWDQHWQPAGNMTNFQRILGDEGFKQVVEATATVTRARLHDTIKDAFETHPHLRGLPAPTKEAMLSRAYNRQIIGLDNSLKQMLSAQTPDDLNVSAALVAKFVEPIGDRINDFSAQPTSEGFRTALSKYDPRYSDLNAATGDPNSIADRTDKFLEGVLAPEDIEYLKSPEVEKAIEANTGMSFDQRIANYRAEINGGSDTAPMTPEARQGIRDANLVEHMKATDPNLLSTYVGGDTLDSTYTLGGKSYGGGQEYRDWGLASMGILSTPKTSLSTLRAQIDKKIDTVKGEVLKQFGIQDKNPDVADARLRATLSEMDSNEIAGIPSLKDLASLNNLRNRLANDPRAVLGHNANLGIPGQGSTEFINPDAAQDLMSEYGKVYGMDEVDPGVSQGSYYVDPETGLRTEVTAKNPAPQGVQVVNRGVDYASLIPNAAAPNARNREYYYSPNPTSMRITKIPAAGVNSGFRYKTPIEDPATTATWYQRAVNEHPEFFAGRGAYAAQTRENMVTAERNRRLQASHVVPDKNEEIPAYIHGPNGEVMTSQQVEGASKPVTWGDTYADMQKYPERYKQYIPEKLTSLRKPVTPATPPLVGAAKSAPVPLVQEPAKVDPLQENPVKPVAPIMKKTNAVASIWARGCKLAVEGAVTPTQAPNLDNSKPNRYSPSAWEKAGNNLGKLFETMLPGRTSQPDQTPVAPKSSVPTQGAEQSLPQNSGVLQSSTQSQVADARHKADEARRRDAAQTNGQVGVQDATAQDVVTENQTTNPTATPTDNPDAAKKPPSTWDQVKATAQDGMDWAQKYNLDIAAIPVGLGLMLMGGKAGAIMGALIMGGGAYGVYQRYQSLNNAGGEIKFTDPKILAAIKENPKLEDDLRAKEVERRLDVMRQASEDEEKWQKWMSVPDNSKFFSNLKLAHDWLPSFVQSRVQASDKNLSDINSNQYQYVMSYMTGGRLGKPVHNTTDKADLMKRVAKKRSPLLSAFMGNTQ
jgi:hypothetical protein